MSELIRKAPNVLGGDARLGDRRIAVWMLVRAKQLGMTDDQVRTRYDEPLTEGELSAAWKYYADHRDEIDQVIRENEDD